MNMAWHSMILIEIMNRRTTEKAIFQSVTALLSMLLVFILTPNRRAVQDGSSKHLVVNLEIGSHEFKIAGPNMKLDAYRTTELWLRWIQDAHDYCRLLCLQRPEHSMTWEAMSPNAAWTGMENTFLVRRPPFDRKRRGSVCSADGTGQSTAMTTAPPIAPLFTI